MENSQLVPKHQLRLAAFLLFCCILSGCALLDRNHEKENSADPDASEPIATKSANETQSSRSNPDADKLTEFFQAKLEAKKLSSSERTKAESCHKDFYVQARFIDAKIVSEKNPAEDTYFRRYEWNGDKVILVDKNYWQSLSKDKQAEALLRFCLQQK